MLDQADTVVWLDVRYRTVIRRVLARTFSRLVTRAELWNGNRERLRDTFGRQSIVAYVFRTHRGLDREVEASARGAERRARAGH